MYNNDKVGVKISCAVIKAVIKWFILMGGQESLDISNKTPGPGLYLPG
jgi:hypothetical protein